MAYNGVVAGLQGFRMRGPIVPVDFEPSLRVSSGLPSKEGVPAANVDNSPILWQATLECGRTRCEPREFSISFQGLFEVWDTMAIHVGDMGPSCWCY